MIKAGVVQAPAHLGERRNPCSGRGFFSTGWPRLAYQQLTSFRLGAAHGLLPCRSFFSGHCEALNSSHTGFERYQ